MKEAKFIACGTEYFEEAAENKLNFGVMAYDKEIWDAFKRGEYFYVYNNTRIISDYLKSLIVSNNFVKKSSIDISKLDGWDLRSLYPYANMIIRKETELGDYIVIFYAKQID